MPSSDPKKKKYRCKEVTPDWSGACCNCNASPILPATGMCGPCTFGEADTIGGNWEDIVDERCEGCDGTCQEASLKSD
jgi:hypothetical protein